MKILSFDVGIINLAYCVLETNENATKLLHWEIITLENKSKFSAHIATSGIGELYINLIKALDSRPHLLDVDIVLIEKQPSFNPKMRIIAGCLQTYFYIRGVVDKTENAIRSVEFFSPKNKLKCYEGPQLDIRSKTGKLVKGKYAQTKKMGVAIARTKLEEYNEPETIVSFFENNKKKDDLSDCYLQALTYFSFKHKPSEKPSKKSKGKQNAVPTKAECKKMLKDFLDERVKVCSVIEIMNNDFKTVADLELPEMFHGDIVDTLTKYNMKKYITLKYK